jgi:hypothetical protein
MSTYKPKPLTKLCEIDNCGKLASANQAKFCYFHKDRQYNQRKKPLADRTLSRKFKEYER